ncbi:MAG: hypothetical protein ACTSQA_04515 [Candidatus Heimdallarchaeaceae archaeon]
MKDDLEGKRTEPFLMIPIRIMKNKRFKRWMGTREFQLWAHLYESIIRQKMDNKLGNVLFREYYQKGILAARWDQKTIAVELGLSESSDGYISRLLSSMEKKGIIKKHKKRWYTKNLKIYELGAHSGEPYKHETLHAITSFVQTDAEKTLEFFEGKISELSCEEGSEPS